LVASIGGDALAPGAGEIAQKSMLAYTGARKAYDALATEPEKINEMESYIKELSNEADKIGLYDWARGNPVGNLTIHKPAGAIMTNDNPKILPGEDCCDVKNEVEAPWGIGPDVLHITKHISLPKQQLPMPTTEPDLELNDKGQMVLKNPDKDMGPRTLVSPENVVLRKGGSKRDLDMYKKYL
jgi:hypothetical protein